jgi:predicted Zn-dependent protease
MRHQGELREILVAVLFAVALGAQPALASNFGSNTAAYNTPAHPCDATASSQCIANNGTHWWYPSALLANQLAATRYASDSVYDPVADVDTVEMTSSSNVDVIVYDSNYGSSYWAWTACSTTATYGGSDPDRWCRPQLLRYDTSHTTAYDTTTERRYLACHEMGHTLGLRHSGNTVSCLYPNQATSTLLASHDTGELNAQYQIGGGTGPVGTEP